METSITTKIIQVTGMTCPSCELKIENNLKKVTGVKEVKASLRKSTVEIIFDTLVIGPDVINTVIKNLGYEVDVKAVGISDSTFNKFRPSFLYNLGRVISYTIIGGMVSALGSVFIFSATAKGINSFISSKFTYRMLKVSAILVIVLGLTMVGRGFSLSGISLAVHNPLIKSLNNVARIKGKVQVVTTTLESGKYQPFIVQKGIPVRWIIKAKAGDLNGCNNPLTIPKYNIQKRLAPGNNVIEFTPTEEGNITYTCWMGMISSNIKVVYDLAKVTLDDLNQSDNRFYGGQLSE